MRSCPVCEFPSRTAVFEMPYRVPDGWPLPSSITWHTCDRCGMIYGDGAFDQSLLNDYYRTLYGAGVNSPENTERLERDAQEIFHGLKSRSDLVVDFGGAGDDGKSIVVEHLKKLYCDNAHCIGPAAGLPGNCAVIYASHVLEHIYDLPEVMGRLAEALAPDGTFIVDVPDATGIAVHWRRPILDFNTKHVNHFTLRNLLDLGYRYGLEMVEVKPYIYGDGSTAGARCLQVQFRKISTAALSREHIESETAARLEKLKLIQVPVNLWGLADISWHLLARLDLEVLDYIDSDPAFRGKTYKGKPVMQRPTNDAPIVVVAQGQRLQLIAHIHRTCKNPIIEI